MKYRIARRSVALLFAAVLAVPGFAQNKDEKEQKLPKNADVENIGNRDINKGLGNMNFTSLEKEITLGRQLAAEIERQVKLYEDPVVNEYVNRVGQNLVRNSDAQVPFTIKVVESEEINAFALPGGFFYVNTGLILAADDESELAGVMAHEIAHVTARHGTEQAAKGQLFNIASIPLIFLGGPIGFGLRQAAGILIPLQFLEFSRDHEAEADYLGLQYLYKTGYDPGAAVSFFEKLQAKETAKPGTISKMFRTHPPTEERISKTKTNIELVLPDRDQYVVTTSEFDVIKTRLAEYENRKPTVEDDRAPSLKRPTRRTDTSPTDDDDTTTVGVDRPDTDKPDAEETKPEDRAPEDGDRPILRRTR